MALAMLFEPEMVPPKAARCLGVGSRTAGESLPWEPFFSDWLEPSHPGVQLSHSASPSMSSGRRLWERLVQAATVWPSTLRINRGDR